VSYQGAITDIPYSGVEIIYCISVSDIVRRLIEESASAELFDRRTDSSMVDEVGSTAGKIKVNQALGTELEEIIAVLDSAARWLVSRGITDPWRPGEWPRGSILQSIERGEAYLAKLGPQNVATITLQWSDELFWPGYPPDTGYIHRLAVADGFHGRQIGLRLLFWAQLKAKENGKKRIRLNCMAANLALRKYYEGTGFICCGELREPRGLACLYEKSLSSL
jgi:ribosomal protein S18 acetylase RimI-like enzyme